MDAVNQRGAGTSHDEWIISATKCRTILVLYFVESVFSDILQLPQFFCDELTGLPAPVGKRLWLAKSEKDWQNDYLIWLSEWKQQPFLNGELLKSPETIHAEKRLQKWLGEADEFGMTLMSITSASHKQESIGNRHQTTNLSR